MLYLNELHKIKLWYPDNWDKVENISGAIVHVYNKTNENKFPNVNFSIYPNEKNVSITKILNATKLYIKGELISFENTICQKINDNHGILEYSGNVNNVRYHFVQEIFRVDKVSYSFTATCPSSEHLIWKTDIDKIFSSIQFIE